MAELLTDDQIDLAIRDHLPEWKVVDKELVRSVKKDTFLDGIRLVATVAQLAESMNHHPDIDLRWRTVRLTCSTHSAGGVTQLDVELAHRIQAAAGASGAKWGSPPARPMELALDAVDPDAVRPFWREALGYVEVTLPDGSIELQDPAGTGPSLWFQRMDPPRTGRDRFHLDVYRGEGAAALRDRLLELGGTVVSDEHAPHWWVMADAEGNVVCVCTT